jgi:phosphonoacetaldehyde methylase
MKQTASKRILIVIPWEDVDAGLGVRRKIIYPMEPAIVVSVLKAGKMTVAGFDCNLHVENEPGVLSQLEDRMGQFEPDCILIMSQHLTFLIKDQDRVIEKIVSRIHALAPKMRVVISGTTPSMYPENFVDFHAAQTIVFRGEIENRIVSIIDALDDPEALRTIGGVCFRRNGHTRISDAVNTIPDLSALPQADREVFPLEDYFKHPETGNVRHPEMSGKFTQMTATRGCNTGCTFCKVQHLRRTYRWRPIDHIIEEIKFLVREKGIEEIHFLDENLFLNRSRARRLLTRIIDENLNFHWFCGGGMAAYMLDNEMLDLMRRSGCYRLHLAVESGSQRILSDMMKKPIRLSKIPGILDHAHHLGFEIIGYFMIGLPTETRAETLDTVAFARNERFDYVVFSIYTPEKETALYDFCLRNDLIEASQSLMGLSKRAASNLRYPDGDGKFLMSIRKDMYQEINFGNPVRREKLRKMFGNIDNE